ncbi:hypothetical protein CTAYLR_003963 [Chrysophaeum taylorii]|uniref:EF-hand domain-containing protein n=1 Tax=Chrysophaeum taylorii TaxID=2483200 RepID=A0AAD7XKV5_9STRA|nr:hypothetical protein CTAYLR_003963 [Chrysophaeum taylorii]
MIRSLSRKFAGKSMYAAPKDPTVGSKSKEELELAKQSRRRRSFEHMSMSLTDGGTAQLIRESLLQATGISADSDPKTKLDYVLQHAKARGLSSEAIFKFFDGSRDGLISADEFKNALASLDRLRLNLSNDEIITLVAMFDKDNDMTVNMQEFKDYCFSLPGTAWRAEKIREDAVLRDSRDGCLDSIATSITLRASADTLDEPGCFVVVSEGPVQQDDAAAAAPLEEEEEEDGGGVVVRGESRDAPTSGEAPAPAPKVATLPPKTHSFMDMTAAAMVRLGSGLSAGRGRLASNVHNNNKQRRNSKEDNKPKSAGGVVVRHKRIIPGN